MTPSPRSMTFCAPAGLACCSRLASAAVRGNPAAFRPSGWTGCSGGGRDERDRRALLERLGRRLVLGLRIVVVVGKRLGQLAAALPLVAVLELRRIPTAGARHIQVDPAVEPLPRFAAQLGQLHPVMALLQHLDQQAGRGVVFHRRQQGHVALHARPMDVGMERVVGDVGILEARLAARADRRRPCRGSRCSTVSRTGNTSWAKANGRGGPYHGSSGSRPALVGQAAPRRQRGPAILVAADAGDPFAGHAHEPAAHQLHGPAFVVQRLDRDRRVGRDLEIGRTVGLDRRRAEHPLHVPAGLRADERKPGLGVVAEVVREDPQALDRAARHALQAGPAVDVRDVDLGRPAIRA